MPTPRRNPAGLDLNLIQAFLAVARAGGFSTAARRLDLPRSRLSLQIQRLEASLGQQLFRRTTRQVALTAVGQRLLDECGPLLDGLQDRVDSLGDRDQRLTGRLRISSTQPFMANVIAPVAVAFAAQHPDLDIDLRASDRITDPIAEGADLSFRVGWLRDSTARARQLGQVRQLVLAAPAYLARRGAPSDPDALADQDWIALQLLRSPLTWTFRRATTEVTVRVRSRLRTDSTAVLRSLLLDGAGLSIALEAEMAEELRTGRLVPVLTDWQLPEVGVHAVFPPGKQPHAAAHAFVTAMLEATRRRAVGPGALAGQGATAASLTDWFAPRRAPPKPTVTRRGRT